MIILEFDCAMIHDNLYLNQKELSSKIFWLYESTPKLKHMRER